MHPRTSSTSVCGHFGSSSRTFKSIEVPREPLKACSPRLHLSVALRLPLQGSLRLAKVDLRQLLRLTLKLLMLSLLLRS